MEELRIKTLEEVEKKLAAEEADIENRSKEVLEMIVGFHHINKFSNLRVLVYDINLRNAAKSF